MEKALPLKRFSENVCQVDESLLRQVTPVSGRRAAQKKENLPLTLRAKARPLLICETNVHFPTDLNLLGTPTQVRRLLLPMWQKRLYWGAGGKMP